MTEKDSRRPPPRRQRDATAETESNEQYVRRLARNRCRVAMRALAGVARDTASPPAARITAAMNIIDWALGAVPGKESAAARTAGQRAASEQVVRLAWMDSKNQKPAAAKKPRGEAGKPRTAQVPENRKDR
jgi:hypothetical protein